MTQTIAYPMIVLTPNDNTGSRTPFVSPVFADAFRKVERLCSEGKALAVEIRKGAMDHWSESEFDPGMRFLENWVNLQFLNAELTEANKELDGRLETLASPLDPRNPSRPIPADDNCMAAWLLDGRRLNLLKGRALHQVVPKLQKMFSQALAETEDEACQVRDVLTRLAAQATFGSTTYSLEREFSELTFA